MHVRLLLCHCDQTGKFIGQVAKRIRTVYPAIRVYRFFASGVKYWPQEPVR
jgi:hypothetical protein